jgi:signal transduction histidine kinase
LIAVSDSGDGIAAEDLERIFDRYARGAQHVGALPGAGIGLAISREIVSAHGGRIWAESAGRGQGSTFTIALPATAARTQVGDPSGGGTVQR